jgi:hypothetical protein
VGFIGIVFALFTTAYILGVWTACLVLKQPQQAYEAGVPVSVLTARTVVVRAVGAKRRL